MEVVYKTLKTKIVRPSGRSSDFILPSIGQGCVGECAYCYAARHSPDTFYTKSLISTNIDDIISLVEKQDISSVVKPNQTHEQYITWDIGCNSDLSFDMFHFDWVKLFTFFRDSPIHFATFATKVYNPKFLLFNPFGKVRVRMSLMPEKVRSILEKKTSTTYNRIMGLNAFHEAGYDVHINFSPVVYYSGMFEDYKELFITLDSLISDGLKPKLKCEVIFLTHNAKLHHWNLSNGKDEEEKLLYIPELQEDKKSEFGGENIRYKMQYKKALVDKFTRLINEYLPYCQIRYIF